MTSGSETLQSRTRSLRATRYDDCVLREEYFTVRALFRRWLAYANVRIAKRKLRLLLEARHELHLLRFALWGLYHEADPSALLHVVGNKYPLRNTEADIKTWNVVFFARLRAGAAVKARRHIYCERVKVLREVRARPQLRVLLMHEKAALEHRIRNEQRLLIQKYREDGLELPPAVLRVRRAEVYHAFERVRAFVQQLRRRPAAKDLRVVAISGLFRWLLSAFLHGLVAPSGDIFPKTARYWSHIEHLVGEVRRS